MTLGRADVQRTILSFFFLCFPFTLGRRVPSLFGVSSTGEVCAPWLRLSPPFALLQFSLSHTKWSTSVGVTCQVFFVGQHPFQDTNIVSLSQSPHLAFPLPMVEGQTGCFHYSPFSWYLLFLVFGPLQILLNNRKGHIYLPFHWQRLDIFYSTYSHPLPCQYLSQHTYSDLIKVLIFGSSFALQLLTHGSADLLIFW